MALLHNDRDVIANHHLLIRPPHIFSRSGSMPSQPLVPECPTPAVPRLPLPVHLCPAHPPWVLGVLRVTVQGFGYGLAVQNVDIENYAYIGELSWGGAASTNWWASPATDTIVIGLTQVAPFTNVLADTIKPLLYSGLKVRPRHGSSQGNRGRSPIDSPLWSRFRPLM